MVIAFLLSAASVQNVPVDPAAFDLRCLLVTERLRETGDESIRATATAAMTFFFGRVDARLNEAQIEAGMRAEEPALRAMTRAELGATLQACGNFMTARGAAMQALGTRMEGPPPPPRQ